mgnify:CR=1 FL=1
MRITNVDRETRFWTITNTKDSIAILESLETSKPKTWELEISSKSTLTKESQLISLFFIQQTKVALLTSEQINLMVKPIGKSEDQSSEFKTKCLITRTLVISLIAKLSAKNQIIKFMISMEYSNIQSNQEIQMIKKFRNHWH